jgi:nucleoside-diphosphate-sugar epimerase
MILITGANGFLGKSIFNSLINKKEFYSLSKTSGDYKVSLDTETPDFKEIFDLVIHAAGKAHSVPKTDFEKDQFHKVNVFGTENLLKGLKIKGVPRKFVFISSVSVYGLDSGLNINEDHPLSAKDSYGLSKIQAEQLVLDWCHKNNVRCTILRLPLLVGNNPNGNLAAMIKGIKKGYYFNIGGGLAKKSMVLAEDVANILVKASEIGGIYNLTDGYHPNFFEISTAIAKQNGKSIPFNMPYFIAKIIAFFGDLVGSKFPLNSNKLKKITSDLAFDDKKAREVIGWQPRKVIDWYNKN